MYYLLDIVAVHYYNIIHVDIKEMCIHFLVHTRLDFSLSFHIGRDLFYTGPRPFEKWIIRSELIQTPRVVHLLIFTPMRHPIEL